MSAVENTSIGARLSIVEKAGLRGPLLLLGLLVAIGVAVALLESGSGSGSGSSLGAVAAFDGCIRHAPLLSLSAPPTVNGAPQLITNQARGVVGEFEAFATSAEAQAATRKADRGGGLVSDIGRYVIVNTKRATARDNIALQDCSDWALRAEG